MEHKLSEALLGEAVDLAAQHVGLKAHKVRAFLETLRLCGYALTPLPRDQTTVITPEGSGDAAGQGTLNESAPREAA